MLMVLVAMLCSSPSICKEVIVAELPSVQCVMEAQAILPKWLEESPYHGWELKGYKCAPGDYPLKQDL
jgi:hypothetical protein